MVQHIVHLVDELFYQSAVAKLERGSIVRLSPDPDNVRGPRTVKCVTESGETVGYLEPDSWLVTVIIDERRAVEARVKDIVGRVARLPVHGVTLNVRVCSAPRSDRQSALGTRTTDPHSAGITRGGLFDRNGAWLVASVAIGIGAAAYFFIG